MFKQKMYERTHIDLMKQAYAAAWKFVKGDDSLGELNVEDRRTLLVQSVVAVFSEGERDVLRIANGAISLVRKIHRVRPGGVLHDHAPTAVM
jgi:hypothetical protein